MLYNNKMETHNLYPLLVSEKLTNLEDFAEINFYGYNSVEQAQTYYNKWLNLNPNSLITINGQQVLPCLFNSNSNYSTLILPSVPLNINECSHKINRNRVENLIKGEAHRLNWVRIGLFENL